MKSSDPSGFRIIEAWSAVALVAGIAGSIVLANHDDALASACAEKIRNHQVCTSEEGKQYNIKEQHKHQLWLSNQCGQKKKAGKSCTSEEYDAWNKQHPQFPVAAFPAAW